MRHFESKSPFSIALLAALAYGAVACSSDSDHGPPVGAPTGPSVIVEGGGSGGTGTGQVGTTSGGSDVLGTAGNFDGTGTGFGSPRAQAVEPKRPSARAEARRLPSAAAFSQRRSTRR